MKNKFNIDLTMQNLLIIFALVISTLLIIIISVLAIDKIKIELDKSYGRFGQLLADSLAVQNSEIMQNAVSGNAKNFLKAHVNSILSSTNDISYITFTTQSGEVVYTTIDTYNKRAHANEIRVSSQIKDGMGKGIGTVDVGLSADIAKKVTVATKKSILTVFSIIWLVFTLVILGNAFLIRRELTLLHHGVKEIEQGKFGTVLNYNQASGEIKELFDAFNDMSKKLHNYEEQNIDQLTIEKNKMEAVLMSIVNGVVVCDNYDKIIMVNSAAEKILNSPKGKLAKTSIQNYCDESGELCFKNKIAMFKNTPLDVIEKKPLEFNITVDKRTIKSVISPMYSKLHDYLGYIIILIDITREAEVDKLKNDFISNVSHELRTPVTILSSYADTLYHMGNQFNYDEQKEFIGTINNEVIRLNKMVNDILDFSRLQIDKKLEKEKQNILSTIRKIVDSHQVLANEKNISITVVNEANLPMISYNAQSIERALSNLVTNAIKYSPNNSRVKIRAEIAQDPNYLEVAVEDNGVGIAPEHQKMIFERFYRVENQIHTVKGTGLGLHLVKMAIEKHHQGKIFVKSQLNHGSVFSFWLPIEPKDVQIVSVSNRNNDQYQNFGINSINDNYSKDTDFDSYFVRNDKEENKNAPVEFDFNDLKSDKTTSRIAKEKNIESQSSTDGWEISFEVRDK